MSLKRRTCNYFSVKERNYKSVKTSLQKVKIMPKTEVEKFMEGVKGDEAVDLDALNGSVAKTEVKADEVKDPEEVPESIKNRQHRRLEQRLQAERESNIALNARLKAYEDFKQNITKEIPVDDRLVKIFGNDTPEKVELAKHFTEILSEYTGKAKKEAIEELKAEQARLASEEAEEIASYESKIESGLESIEDEYGVDLTSDKADKDRKSFLDLVTKIAPKDEDGSPVELPDLVGAYEIFKNSKPVTQNSRRTEIASRSMQQSGQASVKQDQMSEEARWLRQNGII